MLRRLYAQRLPVKQIVGELGRSPDAIVARRKALRIPPRRPRIWLARDDALLRAGTAAGVSATALGALLGRSPDQVRARRRMLIGRRPAGRPYLAQEDEHIRVCVTGGGDLVALARRVGRTPDALRLRAKQLGLRDPPRRRRWSAWEDALVREGYTSALPCAAIARQLPQRSAAGVAARARRLGLVSYARRWSTDDDRRLAQLTWRGDALEDVAQRLGRTPEAIRRRAARIGISSPPSASAPRRARRWTSEEDELLRLHQALNPARLAQLLGRSDLSVSQRLCVLGLRSRAGRSPHHPVNHRNGATSQNSRAARELSRPEGPPAPLRPPSELRTQPVAS